MPPKHQGDLPPKHSKKNGHHLNPLMLFQLHFLALDTEEKSEGFSPDPWSFVMSGMWGWRRFLLKRMDQSMSSILYLSTKSGTAEKITLQPSITTLNSSPYHSFINADIVLLYLSIRNSHQPNKRHMRRTPTKPLFMKGNKRMITIHLHKCMRAAHSARCNPPPSPPHC